MPNKANPELIGQKVERLLTTRDYRKQNCNLFIK